jgi:hypothetical protein
LSVQPYSAITQQHITVGIRFAAKRLGVQAVGSAKRIYAF